MYSLGTHVYGSLCRLMSMGVCVQSGDSGDSKDKKDGKADEKAKSDEPTTGEYKRGREDARIDTRKELLLWIETHAHTTLTSFLSLSLTHTPHPVSASTSESQCKRSRYSTKGKRQCT